MITSPSATTGACGPTSRSAARLPGRGARRVRGRRGRAAGRGRARPGLPRGGRLAEPRVARARRRQARRRRRRQPLAPAPLGRRGRQLLAALLLQERHDRVLRAAGVGLVRRGRRGDRRALGRAGARARRAPRDVGGRGGRGRGRRHDAAADGPVPRARAAPAPRRHVGARPPGARPRARSRPRGASEVAAALDELDRVFEDVTGRAAARGRGRQRRRTDDRLPRLHARPRRDARPARCSTSSAQSLPPVLYASRWWCGRVFDRGAELLGRDRPRTLGPARADARRADGRRASGSGTRWATSSASCSAAGRRSSPARPAADAFADWTPAWHGSAYHSADLQIAAASADAVARGDFLVVLGDFHGGDNPLAQGLFGLRHPDPAAMLRRIGRGDRAGRAPLAAAPRRGRDDRAQLADVRRGRHRGDGRRRAGARRHPPRRARGRLVVDDGQVADRAGTLPARRSRSSSTCRSSSPRCAASTRSARGPGARRSGASSCAARSWSAPAGELPGTAEASPPGRASAASRGASSPARRSSASRATSTSRARRCAARSRASSRPPASRRLAHVEFTEMLPGPDECWLESDAGHHTSELRVVALGRAHA